MDPPTTGLGSPLQPVRRVFFGLFAGLGDRGARWIGIAATLTLVAGSVALADADRGDSPSPSNRPRFGPTFWSAWGDGRAEVASYDLTYPRYGEPRRGTAVAIFVTETFAAGPRVKSEDPRRPAAATFPVIKLNLVQDFATGFYDYNLMTSAFVALADGPASRAGHPTKIAFSSQEWCGQVYSQLVFGSRSLVFDSHSYFDGEADERVELEWPADGVAEDTLLLWARGLAWPLLGPGESRPVRLLRSLETSRLRHLAPAWETATLSRAAAPSRIRAPAGEFEVVRLEARIEPTRASRTYPPGSATEERRARRIVFWVESRPPHRVVRWESEDGAQAVLLGAARLEYWELSSPGLERRLREIGLEPRPARTP